MPLLSFWRTLQNNRRVLAVDGICSAAAFCDPFLRWFRFFLLFIGLQFPVCDYSSISVLLIFIDENLRTFVGACDIAGARRITEKVFHTIFFKTDQPVQSERVAVYLDRIEFDHQIFWIAVRIDYFESLNAEAGKINTDPGFDFKKLGWIVNR